MLYLGGVQFARNIMFNLNGIFIKIIKLKYRSLARSNSFTHMVVKHFRKKSQYPIRYSKEIP